MDQVKIGKFIAERRRARGATQEQLAEMLNITDRAVSKWERGISLPDVSIMPELCDILGITVNDLLSGEIVTTDKRGKELENNLIELLIDMKVSDRGLLATEWIVAILSIIILFIPVIVAAFAEVEEWLRLIIAFSGFIPATFYSDEKKEYLQPPIMVNPTAFVISELREILGNDNVVVK